MMKRRMSKEARAAEVEHLVAVTPVWASTRMDVEAVALVGSWARQAPRDDSDVDLVILTNDPPLYIDSEDWATDFGVTRFVKTSKWGALTERRSVTASGLEVEFGITSPAWASTDPADSGTLRVAADGIRILYDRTGRLAELVELVTSKPSSIGFARDEPTRNVDLGAAWDEQASAWIEWARAPEHDSYWRFGRAAFFELLPPPGRLTIDLGCGEGRVSRDLIAAGHRVVALDASKAMMRAAAAADAKLPGLVADAAAVPLVDGCCDLVVAYMSLHDIDDMEGAVSEAARVLAPGGHFCIAVVHPINSAGGFTDAEPDSPFVIKGSYLDSHQYVDRVQRGGMQMTFSSRHHPLEDYFRAFEAAGLVVEALREVPVDEDSVNAARRRSRWRRLPLFLDIRAVKR
jgi:SAM-dependent methyltransferase